MLTHIVVVKLKPGTEREKAERVVADLRGLRGRIPEIREFQVGEDVIHSPRSFDYALVARFDDVAALKRYQQHPDHVPVAAALQAMAEQMVSVDFTS
ncbi:MAG: Dabb family protein [Rudaea sp.]